MQTVQTKFEGPKLQNHVPFVLHYYPTFQDFGVVKRKYTKRKALISYYIDICMHILYFIQKEIAVL